MNGNFVYTEGTKFMLNGNEWIAFGGATYGYYDSNAAYLNRVTAAVAAGFNILRHVNFMRTLPYPDYYDPTANAEKNEAFWAPMDYGINQAKLAGIKVLLDLSDMCGFAEQRGYAVADANFMLMYKNFVEWLAERTNSYNGVKYKDEDAIAIFAIAGELGNLDPGVGYAMFNTIAGDMKNAGFKQIIQAGGMKPEQIVDESYGFSNYNPIDILSSPNIDCASTHPYYTHQNMIDLFPEIESYSLAKNKPWFIEEFGYSEGDEDKAANFKFIYDTGKQFGSAGYLFWGFDRNGTDGYGYTGYHVSDLTPLTWAIVTDYAQSFTFIPPDPPVIIIPTVAESAPKHQIIVKDKEQNIIGEISDWFDLKFSDQLDNYGQASFAIPIDSDDATKLISPRRFEVVIAQNGTPVWSGEQVTPEVTVTADSPNLITVNCYTYLEMLNARYTPDYVRYDQIDQAEILKALVVASQAKTDGDFGFTFAPITHTKLRDREYKTDNIMESFVNMSNVIDGVDFWIDENKVIRFGTPKRGVDKSNQFSFEYKVNIEEIKITDDFSSPANTAYAIGTEPDGITPLIIPFADSSARSVYKLREQTVSAIDIIEEDTLEGKAEDLVNTNKSQKRTVRITQLPNTTPSLTQLQIGDSITVVFKKGRYDINSAFRVLGYECNIGEVGETRVTWILADYQSL